MGLGERGAHRVVALQHQNGKGMVWEYYKTTTCHKRIEGRVFHCNTTTCHKRREGSVFHYKTMTCHKRREGSVFHDKTSTCHMRREGSVFHYKTMTCHMRREGSVFHYKTMTCHKRREGRVVSTTLQHHSSTRRDGWGWVQCNLSSVHTLQSQLEHVARYGWGGWWLMSIQFLTFIIMDEKISESEHSNSGSTGVEYNLPWLQVFAHWVHQILAALQCRCYRSLK